MKRILLVALAIVMVLALVSCGGGKTPAPSGKTPSDGTTDPGNSQQEKETEKQTAPSDSDPMEALLAKVGLKLSDIEPDVEYYRADCGDGDIIMFYMEQDTEKSTGAYLRKLTAACKAAADDKTLYEANLGFYMGTDKTEFAELPTNEEIDGYMFYIAQFCYYAGGKSVTVTFGNSGDIDPVRNDDKYYPGFSIDFNID